MTIADQSTSQSHSNLTDASAFAALVRARLPAKRSLGQTPAKWRSDFDLNPNVPRRDETSLKPAAVLVGVVARYPLTVILTQRTATLSSHAGQIAFPGGRIDGPDETPDAAALREAFEEIGLQRGLVQPLGFLDSYQTATGYAVEPLIGLIEPTFALRLEASEVSEAFEVPLAFLMNEANHQTHTKTWQGTERRFYAMPYQSRYIWGATAGILKNMHERLFA
jgi:8-oxo-dGTP pyrophosphatase MutT (NUDIX family)